MTSAPIATNHHRPAAPAALGVASDPDIGPGPGPDRPYEPAPIIPDPNPVPDPAPVIPDPNPTEDPSPTIPDPDPLQMRRAFRAGLAPAA